MLQSIVENFTFSSFFDMENRYLQFLWRDLQTQLRAPSTGPLAIPNRLPPLSLFYLKMFLLTKHTLGVQMGLQIQMSLQCRQSLVHTESPWWAPWNSSSFPFSVVPLSLDQPLLPLWFWLVCSASQTGPIGAGDKELGKMVRKMAEWKCHSLAQSQNETATRLTLHFLVLARSKKIFVSIFPLILDPLYCPNLYEIGWWEWKTLG